jgi:hypothetical protein
LLSRRPGTRDSDIEIDTPWDLLPLDAPLGMLASPQGSAVPVHPNRLGIAINFTA